MGCPGVAVSRGLLRAACLLAAPTLAFAQTPGPWPLAIESAYYAGDAAAGRDALEALSEADDLTRAWALWRVARMHRIRDVNRQTKRRHERIPEAAAGRGRGADEGPYRGRPE